VEWYWCIPVVLIGIPVLWAAVAFLIALVDRFREPAAARPRIFDKVSRYLGMVPEDKSHYAYVTYGFLLAWLVERGLVSNDLREEYRRELEAFSMRAMTGPQLYKRVAGVLADDMVSQEGAEFLRSYLGGWFRADRYLKDYLKLFDLTAGNELTVEGNWENYERVKVVLHGRFREWQAAQGPSQSHS